MKNGINAEREKEKKEMELKHNEKILGYKGNNYEEFAALFTEEELEEMAEHLSEYYDFNSYKEDAKGAIISAYVIEWLAEQIKNKRISGTKQLYRLWQEVL